MITKFDFRDMNTDQRLEIQNKISSTFLKFYSQGYPIVQAQIMVTKETGISGSIVAEFVPTKNVLERRYPRDGDKKKYK